MNALEQLRQASKDREARQDPYEAYLDRIEATKKAKLEAAIKEGYDSNYSSRPTATKARRRITADDASVHGSQYLGREGQTAWMPR